jgi:hypothetical protein
VVKKLLTIPVSVSSVENRLRSVPARFFKAPFPPRNLLVFFPVSPQKQKKHSKSPDYSRIVLWIQAGYGSRFVPGMDANEVRMQLEAIITNEQARGIPQKTLKGLRSFID